MAMIQHPELGLPIGDPQLIPFQQCNDQLLQKQLVSSLDQFILSASGWRSVFVTSDNGEDASPIVKDTHLLITSVAAQVFANYLKEKATNPIILLGIDTRPTGPQIADIIVRTLLAQQCTVIYPYIVAAPEIMAHARNGSVHGFIYISASHNPIGYNGIKFGLTDGGVIPASEAMKLIDQFKMKITEPCCVSETIALIKQAPTNLIDLTFTSVIQFKKEVCSSYLSFIQEMVTSSNDSDVQKAFFQKIKIQLQKEPIGIVIDFNGSARTLAPDIAIFTNLGCKVSTINNVPGQIAHRIVPEGESLEPARKKLIEMHAQDPCFIIAYMPDCDGDRGNVVLWDENLKTARSLEAQEVFALCCMIELAYLVWDGQLRYDVKGNALDKVAVVVNDPTSMRIDRIAQAFDVSVFRAEVGEANVVTLAKKLREQGYTVRYLGEGSAGGVITYPSSVRDPIATMFALLKLLTLKSSREKPGLFEIWCDLSNQAESYTEQINLVHVISTLPSFVTTSTYTPEAIINITTRDHSQLKGRYQKIFESQWQERKEELKTRYGITSWEALAYNGIEERHNLFNFSEAGKGGLKIIFKNKEEHPVAFMWMRGSGTEPLFRIMVDAESKDPRIEQDLLAWHRHMIEEADKEN
jgi:phosphoglucomutase